MTPRQLEYLRHIEKHTATHGQPPTGVQIAKDLGIGSSTVTRMLTRLEAAGVFSKQHRRIVDRKHLADFLPPDVWLSIVFEAERRAVRPEVIVSAICRQHFAGATKGQHHHAKG